MKAACVIVAVILLAASLACIGDAVVSVIRKSYDMWALRFWMAVVFHAVTASLAAVLLTVACRKETVAGQEEATS